MKLKQIVLMNIAVLSLSGSLYSMQANIDYYTLRNFCLFINTGNVHKIQEIAAEHPTIVNAVIPVHSFVGQQPNDTVLDYALGLQDPEIIEILLRLGSNVNMPGKDRVFALWDIKVEVDVAKAKQILHLLCTAGVNMDEVLYHEELNIEGELDEDEKQLFTILQNHINTRLATAISLGNVDEVRRLITTHNIDINQELPYYRGQILKHIDKNPHLSSFIPLHEAVSYQKNDVARLLINDLNANVTIINQASGKNALHHEVDCEIARLLIIKGCNPNLADHNGRKPIDNINLTPDMLHELRGQPERIANIRAIKALFEGHGQQPDPNNPTGISNNAFSWKWLGGSVVVVIAVVAGKKLYDWYYKKAKTEENVESASVETMADKEETENDANTDTNTKRETTHEKI